MDKSKRVTTRGHYEALKNKKPQVTKYPKWVLWKLVKLQVLDFTLIGVSFWILMEGIWFISTLVVLACILGLLLSAKAQFRLLNL